MFKRLGLQAILFLLAVGLFVGAHAQSSTSGNISGTVRDPQGAAVPNVEVTILEENTGAERTVTTDDDGNYTAASLPVGLYSVSATPEGYKKTVVTGFELNVTENAVIDLTLEIGLANEIVTVAADDQQIETRSGRVSSLIDEKQVTELPLNGRNYAQLMLLVPGTSPATAGNAFNTGGTGLNSGVDVSVNGNASNQNMWTVDGVNNMDVGSNRTLLVFPSIDSIQEFRVERNSFSAEYGQAQGAVINLVTKGGGNDFHGSGFEFLRNDALNANSFFLNRAGQPRSELTYNNFGGNFSGPVYLPKFGEGGKPYFSGKNKLFFWWSEEFRREQRGAVLGGRVPTAAERSGDFSGALTGNVPVDPRTCVPAPTAENPNALRCNPFPGNRIPTDRLSPAGLALLRLYPNPNTPNPTRDGQNWASSTTQPISTRQDLFRVDGNVTDKMNVMVRYINENWSHAGAAGNFWGDSPFPTLTSDWDQPSYTFAVKVANTLSATAVNEFQFSRAGNSISINTSPGSQPLEQEIAAAFPTVFPTNAATVPSLFWGPGGYDTLWHQAPWSNQQDLLIWKDDFSKVIGSHDTKFGVLFSRNVKREEGNGAGGGNQPAAILGCGNHTGNCIADLLVRDLPLQGYSEQVAQPVASGRWGDFEFYGNDTWKASRRVTLSLGLRYSRFPQAYEANNRISNFIPSLYNGTDYRSALITADQAEQYGLPRSLVNTYGMGYQPRVGIAFDVFGDGKSAVRAGFGRYMSRSNVIEDISRMAANPPFTTSVSTFGGGGQTDTLANCRACRSLDTINPDLINNVAGVDPAAGFAAVDVNFRPPDSYQWNLTVSREILRDTILEASYIGNQGHHIWRRNVDKNDLAPGAGRIANANALATGQANADIVTAFRPLRGVGRISTSESTGNSNYNALQVFVNRRFSNRLSYSASYTWGHAISDVPLTSFTDATSDPYDYSLDRGDSDLDRRHSFTSNAVYALPTFESLGSFASRVLGDWQLNGIFSYFGSTPLDLGAGVNTVGTASGVGQRPNLNLGVPIYLDSDDPTRYLNPAAFSLPAPGQLGNLGRGAVRGRALTTVDFSTNKNWRIRERFNIQFRAEFFNIFNKTNFIGYNNALNFQGNPTSTTARGTITNGGFGTLTSAQRPREIQFGLKFNF